MEDLREKVIKGLKCCRNGFCFACPYDDGIAESMSCKQQWADDALTLLKALDVTPEELERLKKCRPECKIDCLLEHYEAALPHLLTFEEATGDDECWLEWKDGGSGYADIYCCTGPGDVQVWRTFMPDPVYLRMSDFGKKWRCWSHKPTDEQREATPWD